MNPRQHAVLGKFGPTTVTEDHVPRIIAGACGDQCRHQIWGDRVPSFNQEVQEGTGRRFIRRGQDDVFITASDHHIRPVSGHDDILAAPLWSGTLNMDEDAHLREDAVAVITQHNVGGSVPACIDQVVVRAAQNHVRPVTRGNVIFITVVIGVRFNVNQNPGGIEQGPAVIPHDDVRHRRIPGRNDVGITPAEDYIRAVTRDDGILAAMFRCGGFDGQENPCYRIEGRLAVVADNNIRRGVAAGIDHVSCRAAYDDIGPLACLNLVAAAGHGIQGADFRENALGEKGLAVIAHNQVVCHIRGSGTDFIRPEASEHDVAFSVP